MEMDSSALLVMNMAFVANRGMGRNSGSRALGCKGLDRSCMADAFAVWAIFCSNQWSTTGPSRDVVRAVLSVGKCSSCCLSESRVGQHGSRLYGDSLFPLKKCHNDHTLDVQ